MKVRHNGVIIALPIALNKIKEKLGQMSRKTATLTELISAGVWRVSGSAWLWPHSPLYQGYGCTFSTGLWPHSVPNRRS